MKKADALQQALSQSLDQANAAQAPRQASASPAVRRCTKVSVSLFDGDLQRLDSIRDYMQARGTRLSLSQAVKLAIRTAPLSEALVVALEDVKKEDGRKW